MRELQMGVPDRVKALQQLVGAERVLRLIRANGTLLELFRMLQYVTLDFAQTINSVLDEEAVEELCGKTINAGRSLGSLHLALRELRTTDETLLKSLEQKIGAERLLHLIRANGTLLELFRMLQYVTLDFARAIITALDEEAVEELCSKTINTGRSIGTLNLALRELRTTDETLLKSLEQKIGAERLLHL